MKLFNSENRKLMFGILFLVLWATFLSFVMKEKVSENKKRMQEAGQIDAINGTSSLKIAISNFKGSIVLVISESASRGHFSLYGYHRDTTPNLAKKKNELLVQQDTISPHCNAMLSLREILTGTNIVEAKDFKTYNYNLVNIMKRAGFKTFWISNQDPLSIKENPVWLIAKEADEVRFLRDYKDGKWGIVHYDGETIPYLKNALHTRVARRFIVLHWNAARYPYCDEAPKDYQTLKVRDGLGEKYFGDAEDRSYAVNCYDNSLLYLDTNLASIIELAERQPDPTVIAYLSDHAGDPALVNTNAAQRHSALDVEIPHIWYFNSQARQKYYLNYRTLQSNMSKPFRSSDLYHTVLNTALVEGAYEASHSLISQEYQPYPRQTVPHLKDGKIVSIDYDRLTLDEKDYLEMTRLSLEKINHTNPDLFQRLWAHRVDTIGKMLEAKKLFAGVEFDAVFDDASGRFMIYHPPVKNIGLELSELLRASQDEPLLNLWLDWKNATPNHFDSALSELERLDQAYKIKARMIVETGSEAVFGDLKRLRRNGWMHSYYLPTDEIVECSQSSAEISCTKLATSIKQTAREVGAGYLSFDNHGYPFILNYSGLFSEFKLLTWNTDIDITSVRGYDNFTESLRPLNSFLVTFPSRYFH